MTMEPLKEFVKKCLDLADEFLQDAKLSFLNGRLRSTVNNAYYAMYHAAQGILASREIEVPKTHKGLHELFGREIIKSGIMEREFGRALAQVFEAGQRSIYDIYADFRDEVVSEILRKAEVFVSRIKELLS